MYLFGQLLVGISDLLNLYLLHVQTCEFLPFHRDELVDWNWDTYLGSVHYHFDSRSDRTSLKSYNYFRDYSIFPRVK